MQLESGSSEIVIKLYRPGSKEWHRERLEGKGHKFPAPAPEKLGSVRPLTEVEVLTAIAHIRSKSSSPLSDEVKLLLAVDAGLYVPEIAAATMDDVCDDNGQVGETIVIQPRSANRHTKRIVTLSNRSKDALRRLRVNFPDQEALAFAHRKYIKQQDAVAVYGFFDQLYKQLGFVGCTGLSGRATYLQRIRDKASPQLASSG